MTHKIGHHKVSTVLDSVDTSLIRPSDWNQTHDIVWGFATPNASSITSADANTPGDEYWGNVSMLMHMEGVNNSTSFIDQKGKTVTANGNAKLSVNSYKSGSSSAYFDGSGDFLSAPIDESLALGTDSNWTIECWVKPDDFNNRAIMSLFKDSNTRWSLEFLSATTINCAYMGQFTIATPLVASTWIHIALVCISNVTTLYVNGVPCAANRGNMLSAITTGTMAIGWTQYSGYEYYYSGYIDEFRITKGVGRYTSNFSDDLPSYAHFDDWPSLTFQDGWNYQSTGPILVDDVTIVVPNNCNWVVL